MMLAGCILCSSKKLTKKASLISCTINSYAGHHVKQEAIQKIIENVGEKVSKDIAQKGVSKISNIKDFFEKDEYKDIRNLWIQDFLDNIEKEDLYRLLMEAYLYDNEEKFISSCISKCDAYIKKNYSDQE